ncbi:MAG: HDIG domain-containing protein [Candidatus Aceula meridiana]|nr:HDIG domain-containing protein [Candidatus Aceula meridiana]
MKSRIISNLKVSQVVITAVIILAMALFCLASGFSLEIPFLFLLTALYFLFLERASGKLFLQVGLLILTVMFITHTVMNYTSLSVFLVPVAFVGMLVMLLFNDLHLAFIAALLSSAVVGLIIGNRLDLVLTFFTGSLVGIFSVKDSRTRSELINAGFFIGVAQLVSVILFNPSREFIFSVNFASDYLRPFLLNGVICAFGVVATLKIFENLFHVVTNFSLLELSDFNHPLLKRMILEAPGTYHHSLFVSNMAEAAADSVGANALLARVGAYYHDIGKLEKPEYFTENQIFETNKHDRLEPSMSRLVILNHVKDGVELAKKYKLNPALIDFIAQHHGTSLMYYFYQKAVSDAEEGEKVEEQTFRYPGPKPQTRETAIVLLADSVEGACRALDEPTPSRINETVHKIVNNKFIDGQLDDCNLTLKDLEKISSTFSRVLSAMHHTRIKYPEKKDATANNRKKFSEANSSKFPSSRPKDQKNS